MKESTFQGIRRYTFNTVIIGTGAAGYNAADELANRGQTDIAIVTEHVLAGTSRNTGSDKQTYYKLTLAGSDPDSVGEMAKTLFAGRCVDGEHALCEAALSVPCFLKLAGLGVPFPQNRYGEYVGYKTDHDPRCRATSVGPYTSRTMTEVLERSVNRKGIRIFDRMQAVAFLSDRKKVYGLLCLDTSAKREDECFAVFCCKNVVMATGGPAGMYRDSVYPFGHYGATGIAFEAGAAGKNLTEWQYGLASVRPRWNVSGTYMQVLPAVYSTKEDGSDEHEFLYDFFSDEGELLSKLFLKGYQWPFDVRKVKGGSSMIDILVYLEQQKGRRVYLDYRRNPGGHAVDFASLSGEAEEYLEKAGACFGTPIERLERMNAPAVDFYRDRGVDLHTQPLEIALCAQHNNGGLSVDAWWQTNLEGLFCVGEAAGSHGVYRPGGSALNAGQVGSARAALYIASLRGGEPEEEPFAALAAEALAAAKETAAHALANGENGPGNIDALWDRAAGEMSISGAAIREPGAIRENLEHVRRTLREFGRTAAVSGAGELGKLFRLRQMLISQQVYLSAMLNYLEHGGKSRGSALYTDMRGEKPYAVLPDAFTFSTEDENEIPQIQEVVLEKGECRFSWREAHPIPEEDNFFENVWRGYRENKNVF